MRKRREYLRFLDKSVFAIEEAVDAFNRVGRPYKVETCLILSANAWELLAKAVLVKNHKSIRSDNLGNTISGEVAISRLREMGVLDENQDDCIQQTISLRNCAIHNVLPTVAEEILHHLLFFGCKFFREVVAKVFASRAKVLSGNYLSLSFTELTTYADKVQKLVARVRRSDDNKRLVWLLERGVRFDGTRYLNQDEFEAQYRRKKRVLPHLSLGDFVKKSDMVRVVAIQAPRNYTADLTLRKGNRADASLPVVIKKTDLESDYPFLTRELGEKLGKNANYVAATIKFLGLKNNSQFHQQVRASRSTFIHRHSQATLEHIRTFLQSRQDFNPYKELKKATLASGEVPRAKRPQP
jgi:hypothetical protein